MNVIKTLDATKATINKVRIVAHLKRILVHLNNAKRELAALDTVSRLNYVSDDTRAFIDNVILKLDKVIFICENLPDTVTDIVSDKVPDGERIISLFRTVINETIDISRYMSENRAKIEEPIIRSAVSVAGTQISLAAKKLRRLNNDFEIIYEEFGDINEVPALV